MIYYQIGTTLAIFFSIIICLKNEFNLEKILMLDS